MAQRMSYNMGSPCHRDDQSACQASAINFGQACSLKWTSSNASSCTAMTSSSMGGAFTVPRHKWHGHRGTDRFGQRRLTLSCSAPEAWHRRLPYGDGKSLDPEHTLPSGITTIGLTLDRSSTRQSLRTDDCPTTPD